MIALSFKEHKKNVIPISCCTERYKEMELLLLIVLFDKKVRGSDCVFTYKRYSSSFFSLLL